MLGARDSRQYVRTAPHEMGNSLYTPFSGQDGDGIVNTQTPMMEWHGGALVGLPVGDFPEPWPPHVALPDQARDDIRAAYRRFGLVAS